MKYYSGVVSYTLLSKDFIFRDNNIKIKKLFHVQIIKIKLQNTLLRN